MLCVAVVVPSFDFEWIGHLTLWPCRWFSVGAVLYTAVPAILSVHMLTFLLVVLWSGIAGS